MRARWRAGWRVDAASGARPVGALAGEQTLLITTLPLARGSPSNLAAPLACPVSARTMSGWRRGCLWRSLRVHTCLSRVHTCLWRCPRSFLRVGLGAGEAQRLLRGAGAAQEEHHHHAAPRPRPSS